MEELTFEKWWNSVNHTPAITKAEYGSDTPMEDVCKMAWNAAVESQRQSNWISVEEKKPKGDVLVYLAGELLGRRVHSAKYDKNVTLIGSNFYFDAPHATHWQPLPAPPKGE